MIRLGIFAFGALLLLSSCDRGGGEQAFGEACTSDAHCRTGLCVSVRQGASEGQCTSSCATDGDCPRGHSCSGATNNNVVVCMPGPAVPIGGSGVEH